MTEPKPGKLEEQPAATTTMSTVDDRISSLPDSLLRHILSFLPTRMAVLTSVLSRRWRHVWEYLQVFNFYDSAREPLHVFNIGGTWPSGDGTKFIALVNAVLALRRVRHIQKFRLECEILDKGAVATWLRASIGPHLQELYLQLHMTPSSARFCLPHGIFTCTALVSLTLQGMIHVEKLSSVHLPSLKNLEMYSDYVNPIDKLLSGCPVLDTLKLISHAPKSPRFHMPSSLKSLSLTLKNMAHGVIPDLEINTPFLEYLDIVLGPSCSRFSFSNLHKVVEARVDFFPSKEEPVDVFPKLLMALRSTKVLKLKLSATKCLLFAPTICFPEFCCLLELHLVIPYFNSRFLIDLLRNCHMLQVLSIKNRSRAILRNCKCSGKEIPLQTSCWTQPTSDPKCVISHLKTFTLIGYQDYADEREFVVYMLERGLVLKTMKIRCYVTDHMEAHDIRRRLSLIRRGSNMCQLECY